MTKIVIENIPHAVVVCAGCQREAYEPYISSPDDPRATRRFTLLGWKFTNKDWLCPECVEKAFKDKSPAK